MMGSRLARLAVPCKHTGRRKSACTMITLMVLDSEMSIDMIYEEKLSEPKNTAMKEEDETHS
jgi:hypothetical protein